jgi:hypothetical protein
MDAGVLDFIRTQEQATGKSSSPVTKSNRIVSKDLQRKSMFFSSFNNKNLFTSSYWVIFLKKSQFYCGVTKTRGKNSPEFHDIILP